MPLPLPLPTLDHVVVNVRDRIDEGAETYRRLGFTLTPRGYHTLGSMNHLAMFGTEYLELIAAPAGDARRQEILAAPEGLNGLVWGSEDSNRTYEVSARRRRANRTAAAILPPGRTAGRSARCDVPHGARDAGNDAGRAAVFLSPPHARPGVARRMAASRERRDRRDAGGDRRAGSGVAGRIVRADVRCRCGAGDRRWVPAAGRAVAVRRDHPGGVAACVRRRGAGRAWAGGIHGGADLAHTVAGGGGRRAARWAGLRGWCATAIGSSCRRAPRSARCWSFANPKPLPRERERSMVRSTEGEGDRVARSTAPHCADPITLTLDAYASRPLPLSRERLRWIALPNFFRLRLRQRAAPAFNCARSS